MKFPLKDILKVRELRANSALNKLSAKRHAAELAMQKIEEKKEALLNYKKWRQDKEDKMYADVQNKTLSLHELDHFNLSLQWMRTSETVLKQEIKDAEVEAQKANKAVEEAKANYQKVLKDKVKIEELDNSLQKDLHKKQMRKADEEIDESFLGGKR